MEALAMMLRARERRKLHQIEEALCRENPDLDMIVGHTRQWPRGTVPLAVLCLILTGAPQGRFHHCGPSGSNGAVFGPRSRESDPIKGILSYFVVVGWVSLLSFPALTHDHAVAGVEAG